VTRKQTRRQRHTGESSARAEVGDLAATDPNYALNLRCCDKRVEQMTCCALKRIGDAREVDRRVPCIEES
jgi:hypothetical protein